jgi:hypothetical protein
MHKEILQIKLNTTPGMIMIRIRNTRYFYQRYNISTIQLGIDFVPEYVYNLRHNDYKTDITEYDLSLLSKNRINRLLLEVKYLQLKYA